LAKEGDVGYEAYAGIEVSGQSVAGTLQGFRQFKSLASKYLLRSNMGSPGKNGVVEIDLKRWYPLDGWLSAFNDIASEVGEVVLYQIGQSVMENIQWPPGMTSVEGLVRFIDAGYHMHHRKGGKIMFDDRTGSVEPGIGNFALKGEDRNRYIIETANPYPCPFDKGILAGAMKRLNSGAHVVHDDAKPCRLHGASSCTHIVYKAAPR
jgi:hypothetical protein